EPVLRFLRWYPETFALTARDRFAVLAGLGHDPLLRELVLPLTLGATACLPPEEVSAVPGRLLDWIRAERITVLHLTPAMDRRPGPAAPGRRGGVPRPARRAAERQRAAGGAGRHRAHGARVRRCAGVRGRRRRRPGQPGAVRRADGRRTRRGAAPAGRRAPG